MKVVRGDEYVRVNIVMQAQFTVYQCSEITMMFEADRWFLTNARGGPYYDDDRLFSNRKLAR